MFKLYDWLYRFIVWAADKGQHYGQDSGYAWGAHLGHDSLLSFSYDVDLSHNYAAARITTRWVDASLSDEIGGLLFSVSSWGRLFMHHGDA